MISTEDYLKNRLMIHPEFGKKYDDVVINNTVCYEHPIHIHECMEIIYVFKGLIECKISFENCILQEGEFVVLNPFEVHQLKAMSDHTVISCIHISQNFFHYSEGFLIRWTGILKNDPENYLGQVNNIKKLIWQYENSEKESVIKSSIERIIQLFRTEFKLENFRLSEDHGTAVGSEADLKRAAEIYIYMYVHCNDKLSLEKMSADFAISKYYLSHFTKKITGVSVQKSLIMIRCDRAELEVLGSDKSIEQIRMEFAFSSNQYFNNAFSNLYGMTPGAYRRKFKKETVLYKGFDEEPIDDLRPFFKSGKETAVSGKSIELILKDGTGRAILVENDGETVKTYDIDENRKICITPDSEECIIILKRQ